MFEIFLSNLSDRRLLQVKEAIAELDVAFQHGEIFNPRYNDIKYILTRAIEEAWDKIFKIPYIDDIRQNGENEIGQKIYWMTDPSILNVSTKIKAISGLPLKTDYEENSLIFLKEILPLSEKLLVMKSKIVKKQPKPVVDKKQYVEKYASKTTTQKIYIALTEITNESYEKLVDMFQVIYTRTVLNYVENYKKIDNITPIIAKCFKSWGRTAPVIEPDYKSIILQEAKKDAKIVQDEFVYKNLRKLAAIAEAKGNLSKVEIISTSFDVSTYTGSLRLSFSDGSHFDAINSIVWSYSKYGKDFARYPLNFTNVIMPDGTKMPQPSEDRMITVFAQ